MHIFPTLDCTSKLALPYTCACSPLLTQKNKLRIVCIEEGQLPKHVRCILKTNLGDAARVYNNNNDNCVNMYLFQFNVSANGERRFTRSVVDGVCKQTKSKVFGSQWPQCWELCGERAKQTSKTIRTMSNVNIASGEESSRVVPPTAIYADPHSRSLRSRSRTCTGTLPKHKRRRSPNS